MKLIPSIYFQIIGVLFGLFFLNACHQVTNEESETFTSEGKGEERDSADTGETGDAEEGDNIDSTGGEAEGSGDGAGGGVLSDLERRCSDAEPCSWPGMTCSENFVSGAEDVLFGVCLAPCDNYVESGFASCEYVGPDHECLPTEADQMSTACLQVAVVETLSPFSVKLLENLPGPVVATDPTTKGLNITGTFDRMLELSIGQASVFMDEPPENEDYRVSLLFFGTEPVSNDIWTLTISVPFDQWKDGIRETISGDPKAEGTYALITRARNGGTDEQEVWLEGVAIEGSYIQIDHAGTPALKPSSIPIEDLSTGEFKLRMAVVKLQLDIEN